MKALTAFECFASVALILICGACAPATVPTAPETPAGNAVETKVQSLDELEVELCRLRNEAYCFQFDFCNAVAVRAEHFMPLLEAYLNSTRGESKIVVEGWSPQPFQWTPPFDDGAQYAEKPLDEFRIEFGLHVAEMAGWLCLPTAKPLGERARELLSDKRRRVRFYAATAVAPCLGDDAAKRLQEVLLEDDEESVRSRVIRMLGYIASEGSIGAIDEARKAHMSDKDFVQQCDEAKRLILELNSPEEKGLLMGLLDGSRQSPSSHFDDSDAAWRIRKKGYRDLAPGVRKAFEAFKAKEDKVGRHALAWMERKFKPKEFMFTLLALGEALSEQEEQYLDRWRIRPPK